MKIQVEDRRPVEVSVGSQSVQCYHQSIECAKAFAMIGMRMMESTGQRRRATIPQGLPSRGQTTPAGQADGRKQSGAPREFLRFSEGARFAAADSLDVILRVHAQKILLFYRLRRCQADN